MDQYKSEDGIERELGVKEGNAAELGHASGSAAAFFDQEVERIKASLAGRLDEDWPGFKFGLDIKAFHTENARAEDVPGNPVPSISNIVVAYWLEPGDLKAWALHCMSICPDLVDRFPWSMEPAVEFLPDLAAEGVGQVRRPFKLGECQALAAIIWAMHPIYEAHDHAVESLGEEGRFAPGHALQMPHSPVHGEDEGSESYIHAVFTLATEPGGDSKLVSSALRACVGMRDALIGAGSLDAARWLVEQSSREDHSAPWRRAALWDMAAIDSMSEVWARLDISRSTGLAPASASIPRL